MAQPMPMALRLRVVEQHLQGHSLAEIARTNKLSYTTVRACWRRFKQRGREGLAPAAAVGVRDRAQMTAATAPHATSSSSIAVGARP